MSIQDVLKKYSDDELSSGNYKEEDGDLNSRLQKYADDEIGTSVKVKSVFKTDDSEYQKKLDEYNKSKPQIDKKTIDEIDRRKFLDTLIYNSPSMKQKDLISAYQDNPDIQKMVGKINPEQPKRAKTLEDVRRENQIIRDEQDYQNRPAENPLQGGLYGFEDSLPGTVIDSIKGARGGSGYRLHTDSWGKRLLVDPEAKKRVLTDLSYKTGLS